MTDINLRFGAIEASSYNSGVAAAVNFALDSPSANNPVYTSAVMAVLKSDNGIMMTVHLISPFSW